MHWFFSLDLFFLSFFDVDLSFFFFLLIFILFTRPKNSLSHTQQDGNGQTTIG